MKPLKSIPERYSHVLKGLKDDLEALKKQCCDQFEIAEKAIGICMIALLDLRDLVVKEGFDSHLEEIYFFKYIKPIVCGELIFYRELLKIWSGWPKFGNELLIKYLKKKGRYYSNFFVENADFIDYYLRKRTSNDELYFLRKQRELIVNNGSLSYLVDPNFSTIHDETVARILAFERLGKFLEREISKTARAANPQHAFNEIDSGITYEWTDKKVYLAELLYALNEMGSINNGNLGLLDLARIFGGALNIEAKELYGAFQDIQLRKKNRTIYLDKLRDALNDKMNRNDM